jgi:hypothetical protein
VAKRFEQFANAFLARLRVGARNRPCDRWRGWRRRRRLVVLSFVHGFRQQLKQSRDCEKQKKQQIVEVNGKHLAHQRCSELTI